MRVLFFNYEYPPIGGGGANANAYLFREFSQFPDLTVDCVTSAAGASGETVRLSENITLYRLPVGKRRLHFWTQVEIVRYLVAAHRQAARLLQDHRYDLCHAFFGFPSGMLAWLRRCQLPYLISLRGSDVPGFNPRFSTQYVVLKPLFRRIWGHAGSVVVNSQGLGVLARDFEPSLEYPVIPNGIDTVEFSPGGADGGAHLLCVSRLVARKGVQHLLEAMPLVLRQVPHARLTIVGEGDLDGALRQRAAELGLAERVTFLGRVPHERLPEIYRSADLFVQPSFYEGMSNTVLEAMACGLPIVATGEGGREELFDGNAVLAPYGDPQVLADSLTGLLRSPEQLRSMGEASRRIALEFSWSSVATRYHDLYRGLAGQ